MTKDPNDTPNKEEALAALREKLAQGKADIAAGRNVTLRNTEEIAAEMNRIRERARKKIAKMQSLVDQAREGGLSDTSLPDILAKARKQIQPE